jgi:peptidoglycan/LPS O-acetylase OafA/YrhL
LVKSLLFVPFMKQDGLLQPLLFVGWSLNYEMYFYILLALALLFLSGRKATIAVAALVAVVPWLLPQHSPNAVLTFYASSRPLEFAMGIGLYYAARAIPITSARRLRWPLLGLSAFVVAELVVYFSLPLPYFPADCIGFGVPAAVLVLTAALMSKCGQDLRTGWIILLGDASYAIYLLHPYVLYFQERVLARRWPLLSCEHSFFGMVLGVGLVCAISCVVYIYLEKPLVDWLAARYARTPRPTKAFLSENPL